MSLLSESETNDFRALIFNAGFKTVDFGLHETEGPPKSIIYAVRGRSTLLPYRSN